MKNFNLFGGGFQHEKSTTLDKEAHNIKWHYNSHECDTTFYVDNSIINNLKDGVTKNKKYGLILESKFIIKGLDRACLKNLQVLKKNYINIFTHNKKLIEADSDFFKFCPANGTWIDEPKIYNKSKNVSMVCSQKAFTPLQQFRKVFAQQNKDKLDLFGRGFNEVQKKEEALCDYMFSVCIENAMYEGYFTEKILDCFATGTIPIYVGAPDIGEYFNTDGIIMLDNDFKFENLTKEFYLSKLSAISENLEKVKEYYTVEDWIYKRYF